MIHTEITLNNVCFCIEGYLAAKPKRVGNSDGDHILLIEGAGNTITHVSGKSKSNGEVFWSFQDNDDTPNLKVLIDDEGSVVVNNPTPDGEESVRVVVPLGISKSMIEKAGKSIEEAGKSIVIDSVFAFKNKLKEKKITLTGPHGTFYEIRFEGSKISIRDKK